MAQIINRDTPKGLLTVDFSDGKYTAELTNQVQDTNAEGVGLFVQVPNLDGEGKAVEGKPTKNGDPIMKPAAKGIGLELAPINYAIDLAAPPKAGDFTHTIGASNGARVAITFEEYLGVLATVQTKE